jgi:hypothetical protein
MAMFVSDILEPLLDDFLGECDQASNGPCSFERGAYERRGRRIAHFHRMVACELLLELDVPSDLVASGTENCRPIRCVVR